ncbi:DUF6427 family protein [Flavobacterium psychrotolerans]|uniref:Beta-carotene 15,15'-monooxygenase n=1 Tax=Flavobacterium psychrotolerans TaxID=2169410 RepID=A0A2U1JPP1_9FLAO|nr:DUF6427 family protein [Flavobacterium psychrotolerans]PWA06863.1 hypothetical protein DB895_02445 [Flavobacterium psychrotolerans]
MITSLFRKSTPLNYSLVILGVIGFFFLYQIQHATGDNSRVIIIEKSLVFGAILVSIFTANFIIKKNGLGKDSAYTVLFYFLFMLFFPSVWNDFSLIVSNFFILLALRRLVSLQSLKAPKEKIFDASLWIFVASVFHFWSILYIILVFIAILFHMARDYRNWVLPFVAFFTTLSIYLLVALIFDKNWIENLMTQMTVDYKINYFVTVYQNLALSIYATIGVFFVFSQLLTLSNRPQILHSSYRKIISAFVIGIIVFVISPNKSNDLLVFTIGPLAMMATSHIEMAQIKWQKEVALSVIILCGIFAFFSQL